MATLQTLERRIQALEARLAEVAGGFGETIYQLRRDSVRNRIETGTILGHLGLTRASEEDIDAELGRE
jgi:hypothetical protein